MKLQQNKVNEVFQTMLLDGLLVASGNVHIFFALYGSRDIGIAEKFYFPTEKEFIATPLCLRFDICSN